MKIKIDKMTINKLHAMLKNTQKQEIKMNQEMKTFHLYAESPYFPSREKFSAKWEEILEESIILYDTLSKLCHLSKTEMAEGIPIILAGDAFSFYIMNINSDKTYDEKIDQLINWFSSDE